MAETIGRKRVMGIAKETTFATPATAPSHMLTLLETPRFEFIQNKVENEAAIGSTYAVNAVANTTRMGKVTLKVKVDEDVLPLLLLQKFSNSTTNLGSGAYRHTLTYLNSIANNTVRSYSLFIDDTELGDLRMSGVMFNNIKFTAEIENFLIAELEGIGRLPASFTHTPLIVNPNEFVGRHIKFSLVDFSATFANVNVQKIETNLMFNLVEQDGFVLGEQELQTLFTTENRLEVDVERIMVDTSYRTDFLNNTRKKSRIIAEDTSRVIGSSSINPKIQILIPDCYLIEWSEDGGLSDLVKEKFKLLSVNSVGVTDAPVQFEITNGVASY